MSIRNQEKDQKGRQNAVRGYQFFIAEMI